MMESATLRMQAIMETAEPSEASDGPFFARKMSVGGWRRRAGSASIPDKLDHGESLVAQRKKEWDIVSDSFLSTGISEKNESCNLHRLLERELQATKRAILKK